MNVGSDKLIKILCRSGRFWGRQKPQFGKERTKFLSSHELLAMMGRNGRRAALLIIRTRPSKVQGMALNTLLPGCQKIKNKKYHKMARHTNSERGCRGNMQAVASGRMHFFPYLSTRGLHFEHSQDIRPEKEQKVACGLALAMT